MSLDQAEPLLTDDAAERPNEQPIQAKSATAGIVGAVNPRPCCDADNSNALRKEGNIPRHFGVSWLVESNKSIGGDRLDLGRTSPKAADQPEDNFLRWLIGEKNKPPFQHPIQGQALLGQAAQTIEPAHHPRGAHIQATRRLVGPVNRRMNVNLVLRVYIVGRQELIQQHKGVPPRIAFNRDAAQRLAPADNSAGCFDKVSTGSTCQLNSGLGLPAETGHGLGKVNPIWRRNSTVYEKLCRPLFHAQKNKK